MIALRPACASLRAMKISSLRLLTLLLAFFILTPAWAGDSSSKIVSVSGDSITVGKKHPKTYKITSATAVTLNGAKTTTAALKPDMEATVTATDTTATSIAAVIKPPKAN